MDEPRSEEQRASASPLTVVVGGEAFDVPILTRRDSRAWKQLVQKRLGIFLTDLVDADKLSEIGVVNIADEVLAELVLAWDQTGVLGGADGLDNMTDQELLNAYRAIAAVAFPLGQADMAAMAMFGRGPSPKASSTNGRSPTGLVSGRKGSTRSPMSS